MRALSSPSENEHVVVPKSGPGRRRIPADDRRPALERRLYAGEGVMTGPSGVTHPPIQEAAIQSVILKLKNRRHC